MRFKAKLKNEQVELLYNLVTPISRLHGSGRSSTSTTTTKELLSISAYSSATVGGGAVVYLDPDHLRISTRGTSSGNTFTSPFASRSSATGGGGSDAEGITCFAELTSTNGIFYDHRIESEASNVIVFELSLVQLRTALQSILASSRSHPNHSRRMYGAEEEGAANLGAVVPPDIVMKLAKRGGGGGVGLPCLCLDSQGGGRGGIEVHHAIPVRIMRAEEMQYHLPPRIGMPDVQLELPNDRPLRTVVERLRAISHHVYVEGCMAGELTLSIEGDGASIRTFYNKLIPRFEDCKTTPEQHQNGQPAARCKLKVDAKKLYACLQWQANLHIGAAVSSAVLCMVENEMLVLHVTLNPGSVGFFTYYVPVHFLSDDWD